MPLLLEEKDRKTNQTNNSFMSKLLNIGVPISYRSGVSTKSFSKMYKAIEILHMWISGVLWHTRLKS